MPRTYAPNRIRELRKARKFTQEAIAKGLGGTTTKGTIAKLENSAMALSLDYILGIARVLNVDPGEVIGSTATMAREIPLLAGVSAGKLQEAIAQADTRIAVPAWLKGDNLFALDVHGDSMNLVVGDGGVIVVNPDDLELRAGRYYVVGDGAGEATFKRFAQDPPRLEPVSTNPEHQPIEFGRQPFVTLGRAVWAMQPL